MQKLFTVFGLFLSLILLQLSFISLGALESSLVGLKISLAQASQQVLTFTNDFRVQNGLPILMWNQAIADLAAEHSKNMALEIVPFGHAGFAQRVARFPFRARRAAENVFMATRADIATIARIAVDAWIGSLGHRNNLLINCNHCGVGIYRNSQGRWYVTQLFGLS